MMTLDEMKQSWERAVNRDCSHWPLIPPKDGLKLLEMLALKDDALTILQLCVDESAPTNVINPAFDALNRAAEIERSLAE